jgi:heterodisulfide reductase subunit B2
MRIGYFPGCSLSGSAREFGESLRMVARKLEIELEEVPDWNCCGACSAHSLSHWLALALPARILALAHKAGHQEVLVPCSACYNRLLSAAHEIKEDSSIASRLSEWINEEVTGTPKVSNILEVLARAIANGSKATVSVPFAHKVACYYGCLLVRPARLVNFDRPEDPQSMDVLMRFVGAEPIDWAFKVECCGAAMTIPRTNLVARLCADILEDASARGAEYIVTACPMCHANLDMRRRDIEKITGRKSDIPVLYVTQVFGLAFGLERTTLGLDRHLVRVPSQPEPRQVSTPP